MDLAVQAGVPAEIFSVITGDAAHIGDAILKVMSYASLLLRVQHQLAKCCLSVQQNLKKFH